MRKRSLIIILLALAVGFISVNAKATVTIATFADPSRNSGNPLFTVDYTNHLITGGWADAQTGLTLRIPYNSGHTFTDAWFTMTDLVITNISGTSGDTRGGTIDFYANNTSTNPLVVIDFGSGFISRYGFGANEIFVANNVTITGSEIIGTLSEEGFSFSFANLAHLAGSQNWTDGFTATAAFTSSAVTHDTPEPATICLLGFGVLSMVRRKKSA
ncbi:MAG: PEP-CTERM sorting domain-containing protein [Sedimentisphaerales bacterium]|jgi:hypothetical protein